MSPPTQTTGAVAKAALLLLCGGGLCALAVAFRDDSISAHRDRGCDADARQFSWTASLEDAPARLPARETPPAVVDADSPMPDEPDDSWLRGNGQLTLVAVTEPARNEVLDDAPLFDARSATLHADASVAATQLTIKTPTPHAVLSPSEELAPPLVPAPSTSPIDVPLLDRDALDGAVESRDGQVSVTVREAPLNAVLSLLAQQQGLSIVASGELTQTITVTLQPTSLDNALDALLAVADCTWTRRNDVIYVTPVSKESETSPFFQGREVRVYSLNYISAVDAEKVITGLLSPVGQVFIREVAADDQRRTVEQLVIEDLPPFVDRISAYLAQADQMPRQVMVEAHILQVKLGRDKAHGVNFDALARVSGARMQLWNKGFASDTGPGMVFTVAGADFNGLVDCLTTTTDAKTLASPKVFALNGQESRIQIGQRLGYFVTTTTQTSTMQDVKFLETGVVLAVTPYITDDGQVLMRVQPKVSSGDINPDTSLPEEETTEVETTVLVPDGQGIIIGGLIQEIDSDRQNKLSYLGDLWLVGRLFQRRTLGKERNEVIVALLPRIVGCAPCTGPDADMQWQRTSNPLLTPHLDSAPRPWEPQLPDASHRPIRTHEAPAAETVVVDTSQPRDMPDSLGEASLPAAGESTAAPTQVEMLPPLELATPMVLDNDPESVPWTPPQ